MIATAILRRWAPAAPPVRARRLSQLFYAGERQLHHMCEHGNCHSYFAPVSVSCTIALAARCGGNDRICSTRFIGATGGRCIGIIGMVYHGTLFHRRQRGIPMHSYENSSQIRALRHCVHRLRLLREQPSRTAAQRLLACRLVHPLHPDELYQQDTRMPLIGVPQICDGHTSTTTVFLAVCFTNTPLA